MNIYKYEIAKTSQLDEIVLLKDKVKENIDIDIWQGTYPSIELIQKDISQGYGRIITINNKIVAYTCLLPSKEEYQDNSFNNYNLLTFSRLMTHPDYLNQGIASNLIKEIIKEAKSLHYDGLGITVDYFNEKAINLYIRLGFKYFGKEKYHFAKYILDKYILLF